MLESFSQDLRRHIKRRHIRRGVLGGRQGGGAGLELGVQRGGRGRAVRGLEGGLVDLL